MNKRFDEVYIYIDCFSQIDHKPNIYKPLSDMENDHIPAWKRIAIKQQKQDDTDDLNTEDPLNVTTHLSTGFLSKKEKKRIINKDSGLYKTKNRVSKQKNDKKKIKLPKEERQQKKNLVLKDQLRYLLDFYKSKISKELPDIILNLDNVKANYSEEAKASVDDENLVVEVWKFSKSKQIWLTKHFFNTDEIPVPYDDLLIQYFKDLKGRSKDELIEKCINQINCWNEYIRAEEQKIIAMVEGDSDKTTESISESKGESDKKIDTQGESTKEEPKKEKEVELIPPNKETVSRCQKLLKKWLQLGDEKIEQANIVLLNFNE